MCVYVYIYIGMYVYICTYIYMYVCIYICVCVYVSQQVRIEECRPFWDHVSLRRLTHCCVSSKHSRLCPEGCAEGGTEGRMNTRKDARIKGSTK